MSVKEELLKQLERNDELLQQIAAKLIEMNQLTSSIMKTRIASLDDGDVHVG